MTPPRDPISRRAPTSEPDWLTLGQAAKYLGVAQSTIRKWSDVGRVPAFYTPGGHRRYRRGDLDAFLERSGPGRGRTGPLVLVVDDDPGVRQVVRANLEAEGYAVREAGSAAEGLTSLEEEAPDLLLLDVMMPEVDGFAVCRRIKEDPRLKDIPVIFLTAKGGGDALAEGFESGAVMYINKPFTANKLLTIVNTMLESGSNLS